MKKEVKKTEVLDVSGLKKIIDSIISNDIKEMKEGKKKAGIIIIDSNGIRRGRA